MATAEAGTAAVSWVADTKVVVRATPLKFTTEPAMKFVPFTVRVKPALPATAVLGDRLLMVGTGFGTITVNVPVLVAVPPPVVTAIVPLVAPAGTAKVMVLASTTVKPVTATPFSVRAVAPVKNEPVTVTVVPTGPLVGVKLAMSGAGVEGAKAMPRKNVLAPAVARAAGMVVSVGAAL